MAERTRTSLGKKIPDRSLLTIVQLDRNRWSRSPESVFILAVIGVHDDRNRHSASVRIGVHLRSEWLFMMGRITHQVTLRIPSVPGGLPDAPPIAQFCENCWRAHGHPRLSHGIPRHSLSGQLVEHIMARWLSSVPPTLSEELKKGIGEVRQRGWPNRPREGTGPAAQGISRRLRARWRRRRAMPSLMLEIGVIEERRAVLEVVAQISTGRST